MAALPDGAAHPDRAASPDRTAPVRFATANLLHGMALTPGRGAVPGTVDPADLTTAAAELDVDVVALQEVDVGQVRSGGVDQVALIATALSADFSAFAPTVAGTPGEVWAPLAAADRAGAAGPLYGVGLVSRFPLSDVEVVDLGAARVKVPLPRPDGKLMLVSDEPRVAILARVATPGGPVTVAATHLSFVPGYNVTQLRRLGRALLSRPGPWLLLGDLNMGVAGARLLRGFTALARASTYPASRPRLQFDHVLAAGLARDCVDEVSVVRLPVSDHAALRVTLRLR